MQGGSKQVEKYSERIILYLKRRRWDSSQVLGGTQEKSKLIKQDDMGELGQVIQM